MVHIQGSVYRGAPHFSEQVLYLLNLLVWHKCVFLRVSLNRLSVSYLIPLRAFQNVRETIFVLAMY